MNINFLGGSYKGRSSNVNPQECVNLYPEVDREGGKFPLVHYGTPGLLEFCDLDIDFEVRGLHVMGSTLYAVCGGTFFSINSSGTETIIDTTTMAGLGSNSGPVSMANNGTEILIADGTYGFLFDGTNTLSELTTVDPDFPGASSVTFQDGFFLVTKPNTGQIWMCETAYDGTSWVATDYTTAEGWPDNAVRLLNDHRELWIFGTETVEIFYNSGAAFPFERIPGAFLEVGLAARDSLAKADDSIFWLDDKFRIIGSQGYNPVVVSTPQIAYQIAQYATKSDAIGFTYTQEGHTFYQLTFPSANKTWVYDKTTQFWHERMSYPGDRRHRANSYAYFAGKNLVGDYENGIIYELSMSTYTDDGNTIRRIRTGSSIHEDRKRIFWNEFEVEFEAGIGIVSGTGSDPQAMFQWSDDGGHTWSHELWADIGKIGKYANRARWRKLGVSRDRTPRVVVSDPIKVVMIAAYLDAEIGTS